MTVSTYSWMSARSSADAATFRKFAVGIHAAFLAAGWVQTSDTGQGDVTTMTVPTANTAAGYEVWRLNDALQSTAPVFVKIEYGRATNVPIVWITVGQSTDGAGTIGNVLFARTQAGAPGSNSNNATEYPSYASGDGSSIAVVMWAGSWSTASSTSDFFFVVERSRDSSGNATGDGFLIVIGKVGANAVVIGNGGSSGSMMTSSPYLNAAMPQSINAVATSTGSTLSKDGVTAPVLPVPCMAPGVAPWVSNLLVAVHPGDAGSTSVIQAATINGATRTYRAWTAFSSAGVIPCGTSTSVIVPAIGWAV